MSFLKVYETDSFFIEINDIASDKSISHRCAIFSLLSDKPSNIKNYLKAEDTLNTLKIVENLGAKIQLNEKYLLITPPKNIQEPKDLLDCGNSGTAMRLFCGFLTSKEGFYVLHGDQYLASRPMKRVVEPLRSIGAKIDGRENGNLSPLAIRGIPKFKSFSYQSPIASAQVKSAMILAALNSDGICSYQEPVLSRNHTEIMLKAMGAKIDTSIDQERIVVNIEPLKKPLKPLEIDIPSDPSSAFFFAVAAAISKNAQVILKNILLNPTRIEAYEILRKMGADIEYIIKDEKYEKVGDIVVKSSKLRGITVEKNIPWLIDEFPALSIAMAVAKGESIVKNAKELRVKESDRIKSIVEGLRNCQIEVEEFEDGYKIIGGDLKNGTIDSKGDHRVAMSFAIGGLRNGMYVEDVECINTSFPNFIDILKKITRVEIGD